MRAGSLDRVITVQRQADTVNDYGQVVSSWGSIATLRAQLVQSSTAEFMKGFGAGTETAVVFRCRFLAGVTAADRVAYDGRIFNIVEIKELGRREGLELRCTRIGP